MKWVNDWPVIGIDKDGDGKGEPVLNYKKPSIGKIYPLATPAETDDFNSNKLGLQWQWQANPQSSWAFPLTHGPGFLRMYAVFNDSSANLWNAPNILAQKFPAEEFSAVARLTFNLLHESERIGMIVFGTDYAYISIQKKANGNHMTYNECIRADKQSRETETILHVFPGGSVYFKVSVKKGGVCSFSWSVNGRNFMEINKTFIAKPGKWVGAKFGMFCTRGNPTNDSGFADIEWFRVEDAK
jgi:beta-xylosidase